VMSKYRASMTGPTAARELMVLSGTRRGLFQTWRCEPAPGKKRRRLSFSERRSKLTALDAAADPVLVAEPADEEFEAVEEAALQEADACDAVSAMRQLLEGSYEALAEDEAGAPAFPDEAEFEEPVLPFDCE